MVIFLFQHKKQETFQESKITLFDTLPSEKLTAFQITILEKTVETK